MLRVFVSCMVVIAGASFAGPPVPITRATEHAPIEDEGPPLASESAPLVYNLSSGAEPQPTCPGFPAPQPVPVQRRSCPGGQKLRRVPFELVTTHLLSGNVEGCAGRDGRLEGEVLLLDKSGAVRGRGRLKSSVPNGRWEMWCGQQQTRLVFFTDGVADGCEWIWLCTGARDSMGRWARGKQVGDWVHFLGDVPSNVVREGATPATGGSGTAQQPSRRQ